MPTDKSWRGDQSAAHSDQNHIPDTVVVFCFLQTDLGNGGGGGEFRDSDKGGNKGLPVLNQFPLT